MKCSKLKKYIFHTSFTTFFCISFVLSAILSTAKAEPISSADLESALIKLLQEKPEILFNVLTNNSVEFIDTIAQASENARSEKLHTQWDVDLKTDKNIELTNRPIHGNVTAKHTVVGYSDFLCSYCAQAAQTVQALLSNHKDVKFIFKGVPSNEASRIAMKWFYLMYEKDSKKAWQFHDSIFANQRAFSQNHMSVIHELAKRLGYNPVDFEREVIKRDKELNARIDGDIKELQALDLTGTPNFVVNGLILKGAYPLSVFEEAITYSEKNK